MAKNITSFLHTSLQQHLCRGNHCIAKGQVFIKTKLFYAWLNFFLFSLTFPEVRKAIRATPSRRFNHGLFLSIYSIQILTDATENKAGRKTDPCSSLCLLRSIIPSGMARIRAFSITQHLAIFLHSHKTSRLSPLRPS